MNIIRKPKPKNQLEEKNESRRRAILHTGSLPEPIAQNIKAIIKLHARHEQDVSQHQRIVETLTAFVGRPKFLYSILLAIILWIVPNSLPRRFGVPRFDPPPFAWLQFTLTTASLLVTTGVLVTQNRLEKLAEQRAQLTLQLNLLSEQKIAKLIALVEELRRDLPNVKNREDPEAETMKEATDPHAVILALEEILTRELEAFEKQKH